MLYCACAVNNNSLKHVVNDYKMEARSGSVRRETTANALAAIFPYHPYSWNTNVLHDRIAIATKYKNYKYEPNSHTQSHIRINKHSRNKWNSNLHKCTNNRVQYRNSITQYHCDM